MLRPARPFLLLCASALVAACARDTSGPHPAELRVTSDSGIYSRPLAGDAVVHLRIEHVGGPAVALTGCPRPPAAYLERATAAGWEPTASLGVYCAAIYTPVTVSLGHGTSLSFSATVSQAGRYRVRILVGPDPGAPEFAAYSNEFVVR